MTDNHSQQLDGMTPQSSDPVFEEQVRQLFGGMLITVVMTLINASILVVIQYPVSGIKTALIWLGILLTVTAWRAVLAWKFYRQKSDTSRLQYWYGYFLVGVVLSGMTWGSSAIWLFPQGYIANEVFVALVLVGMTAGAVSSLAYRLEAFAGFTLPALLPLMVNLFLQGDLVATALGAMIGLFVVMMLVGAHRFGMSYRQNIELRLQSNAREMVRRESEERYRSVFEYSPMGILHYDQQGIVIGCNQRFAELMGSPIERIIGIDILSEVPNSGITSALRQSLNGQNSYYEGEYQTIVSGKVVNVSAYFSAIRDDADQVVGGVVLADDMTERERVRSELHSTRLTLQSILDTIPVRVYWKNDQGEYLGCNRLFAQDAGFADSVDVIGKTDQDLYWDNILRAYREVDQDIVDNGKSVLNYVEWREYPDGEQKWFEISKVPLLNTQQQVVGMLGAYQDATARKLVEQKMQNAMQTAEEANRAKSDFLSGMSHELRTPLNAIIGFAQVLQMESPTKNQLEFIQYILDGGEHLLQMINQLLDLSRLEAGKLEFVVEAVSFNRVLEQSLSMIKKQARDRGLEIIDNISSKPDIRVQADFTRLKQVLINLLSNASKYNRKGGWIRLEQQRAGNGRVKYLIIDNGIGIDQEHFDDLFQTFVRVSPNKATVEGAGIGLPISKQLIELMGGEIGLSSELDKGSTFWIELLEADVQAGILPDADRTTEILPAAALQTGIQVLHIENDLSSRLLLEGVLARYPGIRLFKAITADEGLKLIAREHFDLILLDIDMPDMDGYEMLARLREREEAANIAVIGVSANAMASDIERAMQAGFDDYITKPIKVQSFIDILEQRFQLAEAAAALD